MPTLDTRGTADEAFCSRDQALEHFLRGLV